MTAPLAPGDSYAVSLFGDPIPTPQLLFALSTVPAPDKPALLFPCAACSREHFSPTLALCPYCRADGTEALTLQEQS